MGHNRIPICCICQGNFRLTISSLFLFFTYRTNTSKTTYAIDIVYNPTIFLTKASILLLYLRAFKPVYRTRVILHIVLWANFAFYLAAIVVEAFQCLPVQKAWFPLLPGHCIDQKAAQTTSAAINAFSDFVILAVPIVNVWGLQLYNKGRVSLITIFSFGILYVQANNIVQHFSTHRLISDSACIASIVRIVKFAQNEAPIEGVVDVTWGYYSLNLVRYINPRSRFESRTHRMMHKPTGQTSSSPWR